MSATSNATEKTIGGQYRLVKELGAGGMGTIYYGIHILTDQPVAIKMLHPALVNDDLVRKRFLSEASVLARMEHPHIVQWKNSIEDESGLYIIMQYVEGDNVESRLEAQDTLTLDETIAITLQTLSGLAYVHSKGVVHRDLKPSNILLTTDGKVKLADFGIARLTDTKRLTKAGMTIGTFFYMAPEQILGHDSDHRADVYAMGVTMYEMLTGRTPFEGDTEFDVCRQHLEAPFPSIRKHGSSLPKKLDVLLTKATAKKPEDRYQSIDEFITAIKIQFPKLAESSPSLSVESTSLSRAEVDRLLKEHQKKPKRGGCMRFIFWLFALTALLLGAWYAFFILFDQGETVPAKRGKVEARQNTRTPAKRPTKVPAKTPTKTPATTPEQTPDQPAKTPAPAPR